MPTGHSKSSEPLLAFRSHTDEVRREVEARLAASWDATIDSLRPHGSAIVETASAARDLTMRGGKRFRAALLVAAYAGVAPRAAAAPALEAAMALELLQSYLLVQDDWMDGDPVRRGGPSAHAALSRVFGNEHMGACSAILAGDLTWGLAVRALTGARVKAERKLRALDLFCAVHQDVIAGQQIDLLGRSEDIEAMHALKTGSYTVRGPLVIGATLAGGSKRAIVALGRYAAPLGVAFQLRDDLLGAFGSEAQTGKREGSDLRGGKRTAVLAAALPRLSPEDRQLIDRVLGKADAADDEVKKATAALERCGARAAVEERNRALCAEAVAIAGALPLSLRSQRILAGAALALLP